MRTSIAQLVVDRQLHELDKPTVTISLTFNTRDDADLLYWCYNRPEQFTPFVRSLLYKAMIAEAEPQSGPAIDEAAIGRIIRRELQRALQNSQIVSPQPAEQSELVDDLEASLASLF